MDRQPGLVPAVTQDHPDLMVVVRRDRGRQGIPVPAVTQVHPDRMAAAHPDRDRRGVLVPAVTDRGAQGPVRAEAGRVRGAAGRDQVRGAVQVPAARAAVRVTQDREERWRCFLRMPSR